MSRKDNKVGPFLPIPFHFHFISSLSFAFQQPPPPPPLPPSSFLHETTFHVVVADFFIASLFSGIFRKDSKTERTDIKSILLPALCTPSVLNILPIPVLLSSPTAPYVLSRKDLCCCDCRGYVLEPLRTYPQFVHTILLSPRFPPSAFLLISSLGETCKSLAKQVFRQPITSSPSNVSLTLLRCVPELGWKDWKRSNELEIWEGHENRQRDHRSQPQHTRSI